MGKIGAALSGVSTEFKVFEPALHTFHIDKVEEKEGDLPNGEKGLQAYIVHNKITTPGHEDSGKTYRDYINLRDKKGNFTDAGLASIKRYFETIFGKEEVATWTDDDYDTDALEGRDFQGQLEQYSYTKEGESEPKKANRLKAMAAIG